MSLYRQPGRVAWRTIVLVALAALVVGLAGGYAIGNAAHDEPTLAAQLGDLRGRLAPAREGLELAPGEYAQAVRGGRVASKSEYGGALAAVRRAQSTIAANRDDLRALSVARTAALETAVGSLATAMVQHRDPAEIRRLAAAAGAALRAAGGL